MSFTYESAYFTGYTTGTTGLKIFGGLTFYVSGLKYDGTGITVNQSYFFTGISIIGSGTISTEVSGNLVYYNDDQYWRSDIAILDQSAPGELASGIFELYWNTGAISASTGWATTTGFIRVFGNPSLDAWNIVSKDNGSVNNADGQHSHASSAQFLYDLDDVFIPGSITDDHALVYKAASGGWTTGVGGGDPDDWTAVSGEVAEITGTVFDYAVFSGSYSTTSGAVADYPAVSGDYAATSGTVSDYAVFSGAFSTTSGAVSDYPAVSGLYAAHLHSGQILENTGSTSETGFTIIAKTGEINIIAWTGVINVSGSRITGLDNPINARDAVNLQYHEILSGAIDDYAVFSGAFSVTSGAIADYPAVSGDYAATSGTIYDYPVFSGSYSASSGDVADYKVVSGVVAAGGGGGAPEVSDVAYAAGWNADTTTGASKNAIYDVIDGKIFHAAASTYPGSPIEGQLYYDSDDEALYRYSADAQAWIQVGGGGINGEFSNDNLGNHTGTEDLNMGANAIVSVGNVDGVDVSALNSAYAAHKHDNEVLEARGITNSGGAINFIAQGVIVIAPSNTLSDYLQFSTTVGVPLISVIGGADVYIKLGATWQTIHADNFTLHTEPLPTELSTDKILNIKNKDGKLDHKSLPSEAYFAEPNGDNEGMHLGGIVMHLIKTIQELNNRITDLEAA